MNNGSILSFLGRLESNYTTLIYLYSIYVGIKGLHRSSMLTDIRASSI